MVRRVFFSFHYQRDVWRASVVRKSWLTQDREDAGFWDASLWEEAKRRGDDAIRRMINNALLGTSVTAVLIGAETQSRRWVKYEIEKSYERGNGLLGLCIHGLKDQNGYSDRKGLNPFDFLYIYRYGRKTSYSEIYPTYDWVNDNGYHNFGQWVEKAARAAGK